MYTCTFLIGLENVVCEWYEVESCLKHYRYSTLMVVERGLSCTTEPTTRSYPEWVQSGPPLQTVAIRSMFTLHISLCIGVLLIPSFGASQLDLCMYLSSPNACCMSHTSVTNFVNWKLFVQQSECSNSTLTEYIRLYMCIYFAKFDFTVSETRPNILADKICFMVTP
jgi:hypothetical protein